MKVRTTTRTSHYAELDELGCTVELEFCPVDGSNPLGHISDDGKLLVIAYLVQDESPSNPLKDSDANGNIYTWSEGVITDDKAEILRAFGLEDKGSPDLQNGFDCIPYAKPVSLWDLAVEQFHQQLLKDPSPLKEWFEFECWPSLGLNSRYWHWMTENEKKLFRELNDDYSGFFSEQVGKIAHELYTKYWKRIVGPYVVPMNYQDHYETRITPTTFDGDPEDPPTCIWVADKLAIQNLGCPPDPAAVVKYAKGVAEEYANWCSGYVYGCVVQVFDKLDDEWEPRADYESCGGFIGATYAEEALKDEFFEPTIKSLTPWVDPKQLSLET